MNEKGITVIENRTYEHYVTYFDEGSEYGINEGRISKLWIYRNGKLVCCYDREWVKKPTSGEVKFIFDALVAEYN